MPAIGYKIHEMNHSPFPPLVINFAGIAIGDGLCDPETVSWLFAPMGHRQLKAAVNVSNIPLHVSLSTLLYQKNIIWTNFLLLFTVHFPLSQTTNISK